VKDATEALRMVEDALCGTTASAHAKAPGSLRVWQLVREKKLEPCTPTRADTISVFELWALSWRATAEECRALSAEVTRRARSCSTPDLISGAAGLLVVAEELREDVLAKQLVDLLLNLRDRDGLWSRPNKTIPPMVRLPAAGAWIDLGVAHGLPGIAMTLAQTCAAAALDAAERAAVWIAERVEPGTVPYGLGAAVRTRRAWPAWCYGPIGVGLALCVVGERARNRRILRKGVDVLAATGTREWRSPDLGLCHGLAGVATCLSLAARITGRRELAELAAHRLSELAQCVKKRAKVSLRPERDRNGRVHWVEDVGLLEGATGIALVLSGADRGSGSDWNRLLLGGGSRICR